MTKEEIYEVPYSVTVTAIEPQENATVTTDESVKVEDANYIIEPFIKEAKKLP